MHWCNFFGEQYLNKMCMTHVLEFSLLRPYILEKVFLITHETIYQSVHVHNNIILKEERRGCNSLLTQKWINGHLSKQISTISKECEWKRFTYFCIHDSLILCCKSKKNISMWYCLKIISIQKDNFLWYKNIVR